METIKNILAFILRHIFLFIVIAIALIIALNVYHNYCIKQIEDISLSESVITMGENDTQTLKYKIKSKHPEYYSDGQHISWATSDSSIVNVDDNGRIVALNEGKCKVSIFAEDGSKDTCKITVTDDNKVYTPKFSNPSENSDNNADDDYYIDYTFDKASADSKFYMEEYTEDFMDKFIVTINEIIDAYNTVYSDGFTDPVASDVIEQLISEKDELDSEANDAYNREIDLPEFDPDNIDYVEWYHPGKDSLAISYYSSNAVGLLDNLLDHTFDEYDTLVLNEDNLYEFLDDIDTLYELYTGGYTADDVDYE